MSHRNGESEEERWSPKTWTIRLLLLLVLALLLLWFLIHVVLNYLLWSSLETAVSAGLWGV